MVTAGEFIMEKPGADDGAPLEDTLRSLIAQQVKVAPEFALMHALNLDLLALPQQGDYD